MIDCPMCGGTGEDPHGLLDFIDPCQNCDGKKRIPPLALED